MRQIDIDEDDDDTYLDEVPPRHERFTASDAMPRLMLEAAMGRRELATFMRGSGITAIVKAPGSEWVAPLVTAAREMTKWGHYAHSTTPDKKAKDTVSRDQVIHALGKGHRVLGVSQNPSTCLPEGMAGAADLFVEVPPPNDMITKRTICAVTGTYPRRMPKGLATGLSYGEICLAIRKGSEANQCVARLVAAKRASAVDDPNLAKVPALEILYGYGEAMDWAQRLIADMGAWRDGKLDFAAIERTVVLASEPGLGKTTFVRSLAKALGVPLIATSVSSWFANSNGHLDGVIKQIDHVFQSAANQAPAIVFLDECEGIPSQQNLSDRGDWWIPVIGHMLLTLDSAGSGVSSKLIVIGATNHPERLDPAMVRPGRLSKILHIERLDKHALVGILRQHLGNDLLKADLTDIAEFGVGASGADVTDWVKVARSQARQAGRSIELSDLLEQVAPRQKRSPETDHRIAVHEAGHAVVMQVLGHLPVEAVSTIGRGNSGGTVTVGTPPSLMSKSDVDAFVTFVLAGRAAEEVMLDAASSGAGGSRESDLAQATQLLTAAHASMGMGDTLIYRGEPTEFRSLMGMDIRIVHAIEADLRRLYGAAMDVVVEHREAVMAVRNALLRERFLTGDRFREIFDRHPPGSKTIEAGGIDG